MSAVPVSRDESPTTAGVDWPTVVHTALVSRALDELEETRLVPARKVLYQFTSRGHDVTQALLAQHLTGARETSAVCTTLGQSTPAVAGDSSRRTGTADIAGLAGLVDAHSSCMVQGAKLGHFGHRSAID